MAGSRRIVVEFLGKDVSAGSEASAVEKRFGKLGGKLDKVGQIAGKALAGGLLLAGAAAVKMTQAAADDEAAASKLANTLRNAAHATDAQVASTEDWISAQGRALAVSDDELRPALARLATATGDVGEAQKLASLAMDVSAGTGKSLEQVSTALMKAQNGQVSGLSRLGIATTDSEGKTKSLNQITKELASTYKGAASEAADTAAGKQKRLAIAFGELQEEIGAKLLPAAEKLTGWALDAVDWMDEHQALVGTLAASVGTLAAGLYGASLAMRAFTVAAAMNPIGLIAVGAATAVAGLVAFTAATRRSGDETKYTLPKMHEYIDTLEGVAAATSRATREMVLERLEKSGLLAQTQALNISDRDAVLAAMGNEAARKRVSAALREAVAEGKNYEALEVARRLGTETTAINSSRVAQLQKNLALAATAEEAQRIQNKLDKLGRTNTNPPITIVGADRAINQLTSIQQLLNDVTRKRGGNSQVPGAGTVLGGVTGKTGPSSATGGRVWAGVTGLVGENGPELFTPEVNGYITPHHKLGSSGGSTDVSVAAPLVLQLDSKTVWQGLLKMKRTGGIVELGLA